MARVRKSQMIRNTRIDVITRLNGESVDVNGAKYIAHHKQSPYRSMRGDYVMDHISLYCGDVKVATVVPTTTCNECADGWERIQLGKTSMFIRAADTSTLPPIAIVGIVALLFAT